MWGMDILIRQERSCLILEDCSHSMKYFGEGQYWESKEHFLFG